MKHTPVQDIQLKPHMQIHDLIKEYEKSGGFTAKKIADGVAILTKMIKDNHCKNFLSFPACIIATGARGLRAILEEVLLNTMYDLPGRTDIGKVVIDENTVVEKVNPTLVPRSTGRQRKAAS